MIESVVVWKWRGRPGYRSTFGAKHVNTMRNMVARHYPNPHRFICITDDWHGLDSGVEVAPLGKEFANLANPSYRGGPNCYRRLQAFRSDFAQVAGARFVSLDLDCVITGDLAPLWDRAEQFTMYFAPGRGGFVPNGSMWMLESGSHPEVYNDFDYRSSPRRANGAGCRGSDQGWINYRIGRRNIASWKAADGVYSYKFDLLSNAAGQLPDNARVVVFHGKPDPWDAEAAKQSPWILEHYR